MEQYASKEGPRGRRERLSLTIHYAGPKSARDRNSRGYVLWYCKSANGNQRDRTRSCRGSLHEREESERLGMKEECYNVERDEQRCSPA